MLQDPAEVARVEGLRDRNCCDSRAVRVRSGNVVPRDEEKMQAAQTMKTNLLMLRDSTKTAAALLSAKRCYAHTGGAMQYRGPLGRDIQTEKWSLDPRVLLFEYKTGYLIRKRQYELTKELQGAAQQSLVLPMPVILKMTRLLQST